MSTRLPDTELMTEVISYKIRALYIVARGVAPPINKTSMGSVLLTSKVDKYPRTYNGKNILTLDGINWIICVIYYIDMPKSTI